MNTASRKRLLDLFAIQSETDNEFDMLVHMRRALTDAGCAIIDTDDFGQFIAVKNTTGDTSPMPFFVAHSDTVHEIVPSKRYAITMVATDSGDILHYAYDPTTGADRGIGGDDKVGLWACLEAAHSLPRVGIVITVQEECGAIGAENLSPEWFANAAVLIQLDRRGNADAVNQTYVPVSSPDWQAMAKPILDRHGYTWSDGAITDVVSIVENGIADVSAVNLSAGYFKPHSPHEYVSERDAENALDLALALAVASDGREWTHIPDRETDSRYAFLYTGKSAKTVAWSRETYRVSGHCDYCGFVRPLLRGMCDECANAWKECDDCGAFVDDPVFDTLCRDCREKDDTRETLPVTCIDCGRELHPHWDAPQCGDCIRFAESKSDTRNRCTECGETVADQYDTLCPQCYVTDVREKEHITVCIDCGRELLPEWNQPQCGECIRFAESKTDTPPSDPDMEWIDLAFAAKIDVNACDACGAAILAGGFRNTGYCEPCHMAIESPDAECPVQPSGIPDRTMRSGCK